MKMYAGVLISDIWGALKTLALSLFCFGVLIFSIATGAALASLLAGSGSEASHYFIAIMNLHGIGLLDTIRLPLAIFNWFALVFTPIWLFSRSYSRYLSELRYRAALAQMRAKLINGRPSNSDRDEPSLPLAANS
jgi:hypothetical protein